MHDLIPQRFLVGLVQVLERLEASRILGDESAASQQRQYVLWKAFLPLELGDIFEKLFARDALERVPNLAGHVLCQTADFLTVIGGALDAVLDGAVERVVSMSGWAGVRGWGRTSPAAATLSRSSPRT